MANKRYLFSVLFGISAIVLSCTTPAPLYPPVEPTIPKVVTPEEKERSEFEVLMEQDSIRKHQTAAESLDILLNDHPNESRISLIVYNESNCNMILRFTGPEDRSLPIYANDKNFIVLPKGTYALRSKLCRKVYASTKIFRESLTLRIIE